MNLSKDNLSKLFLMYRMYFMAGEKAQHLRALAALREVLNSIPNNHKVVHYHMPQDHMPSSSVSEDRDIMLPCMK